MIRRNTFISRTDVGAYRSIGVSGSPAFQSSGQIFDVLERRLSKRHRQVFAEPVTDGRSQDIDWWTDAEGPVTAYADMSPEEQDALRQEVGGLFSDIEQTAQSLITANKGDSAAVGALLRAAMQSPAPVGLYRVGESPVVILWGHEPQTNQVSPIMADPVRPPPPGTPPITPDAPLPQEEEPEERRGWIFPAWLRWLLLALLLLLLAFFLLRACAPDILDLRTQPTSESSTEPEVDPPLQEELQDPPREENVLGVDDNTAEDNRDTPVVIAPDTAPDRTNDPDVVVITPEREAELVILLDQERLREDELRRRIALLEAQIAEKQRECPSGICVPQQTLPEDVPVELVPQQVPDAEPEIPQDTDVMEQPPQETEAQAPPPQQPPQEETPPLETPPQEPDQAQESCPPERQPFDAPEVVVVLDTSGSMAIDVSVPASRIEALVARADAGDVSAIRELDSLTGAEGSRRIDQAQSALNNMIANLPEDVDVGFIEFGSCDSIVNHAFYPMSRRAELMSKIEATEPNAGTPLARALERAGNIIKGRTAEDKGVIVLVSDGYGTCGGDACAAARAIAAQKPGVVINVVTLGSYSEAQCIAQAGNGRVFDAEGGDIRDAIVKASEEPPLPPHCR